MNDEQQAFLERLALRIPRLFEVIRQGNIKSEYIVGIRRIGERHVRLKIVAEVVDPGANPLASHGTMHLANSSDNRENQSSPVRLKKVKEKLSVDTAAKRRRPRKR